MAGTLRVDRTGLEAYLRDRDAKISAALAEVARFLQRRVNDTAVRDTGSLAESAYVVLPDGTTDYGTQRALAAGLNPDAEFNAPEPAPGKSAALVSVAAAHGAYVNYGTSRMPAKTFWEPAVLATEAALAKALEKHLAP